MKIIRSHGGPLIAMRPADVPLWGGIDHLLFFKEKSLKENDYDALCEIGIENWNQIINVVFGSEIDIPLLIVPLPTLIVDAGRDHVYLAQIETSEEGWSDDDLRASDFEAVTDWNSPLRLSFKGGPIVFFDSASVKSDLRREEVLIAELDEGQFLCEWSAQFWPGRARMNLIRMVKQ